LLTSAKTGAIICPISETVHNMRLSIIHKEEVAHGLLIWKLVTLNDLESRGGRYFALFHRLSIWAFTSRFEVRSI